MVLTHSVTGTTVPCIRAMRAIAGLGNPEVTIVLVLKNLNTESSTKLEHRRNYIFEDISNPMFQSELTELRLAQHGTSMRQGKLNLPKKTIAVHSCTKYMMFPS